MDRHRLLVVRITQCLLVGIQTLAGMTPSTRYAAIIACSWYTEPIGLDLSILRTWQVEFEEQGAYSHASNSATVLSLRPQLKQEGQSKFALA